MASSSLNPSCRRRQYLITYSQVNEQKFLARENFANVAVEEFNREDSAVKVSKWAYCRERHQHGGFHYHCEVKLTGNKIWISAKARLMENNNVVVDFRINRTFKSVHVDISVNKIITWPIVNGTLTLPKLNLHEPKHLLKTIGQLIKKDALRLHLLQMQPQRKKRLTDSELSDFIKEHKIKN